VEIFQVARPLSTIPTSFTLRVVDKQRFKVKYTLDGWASFNMVESKVVGYPGTYADVVMPDGPGKFEFTLFWSSSAEAPEHWLGYNYSLDVTSQAPETMPASAKPQS
jgi:glucoamylase